MRISDWSSDVCSADRGIGLGRIADRNGIAGDGVVAAFVAVRQAVAEDGVVDRLGRLVCIGVGAIVALGTGVAVALSQRQRIAGDQVAGCPGIDEIVAGRGRSAFAAVGLVDGKCLSFGEVAFVGHRQRIAGDDVAAFAAFDGVAAAQRIGGAEGRVVDALGAGLAEAFAAVALRERGRVAADRIVALATAAGVVGEDLVLVAEAVFRPRDAVVGIDRKSVV